MLLSQHTLVQTNKSTSGLPPWKEHWPFVCCSGQCAKNPDSLEHATHCQLGVPTLLAMQLLHKQGDMPSQTTSTPKSKIVTSNFRKYTKKSMQKNAHTRTQRSATWIGKHTHAHTDSMPLLLILLLVFDFSGNRVLRDLTIVDKTTLSTQPTPHTVAEHAAGFVVHIT